MREPHLCTGVWEPAGSVTLKVLCELSVPGPGGGPVLGGCGGPRRLLGSLPGPLKGPRLAGWCHLLRQPRVSPSSPPHHLASFCVCYFRCGHTPRFLCDRSRFNTGPRAGGVALAAVLRAGCTSVCTGLSPALKATASRAACSQRLGTSFVGTHMRPLWSTCHSQTTTCIEMDTSVIFYYIHNV